MEHNSISLDDFSASLLHGNLRFGKYPKPIELRALEFDHYDTIIDLTSPNENLPVYETTSIVVRCPMPDRRIPTNRDRFLSCIDITIQELGRNKKIYVHCRGGHGRSALFAACVLIRIEYDKQITVRESREIGNKILKEVREAHKNRRIMDEKWRRLGAPQTRGQKEYVLNFAAFILS